MRSYADISDYYRKYCSYYHTLEADFIATERYLTIDEDNFPAFSNEYIKLIQAICSEIDVVTKYLCMCIRPDFSGNTFPEYCKCILDSNPLFIRANVSIQKMSSIFLAPWFDWKYEEKTNKKENKYLEVTNPEWWTKYNKIKHSRTSVDPSSNKAHYKSANQKNTLNALAALFILNSYILNLLCKDASKEDSTYFLNEWYHSSKLFCSFMVAGI